MIIFNVYDQGKYAVAFLAALSVFIAVGLVMSLPVDLDSDNDGILDKDNFQHFKKFQSKFRRNCTNGTTECKSRKRNYANHLKRLGRFKNNTKNCSYEMGETRFMDWSDVELKSMVVDPNLLPKPANNWKPDTSSRRKRQAVGNFDWRTSGAVNPVRDQGGCGSCWAFATVAAIEIQTNNVNKRYNANRRAFSEQYVLDCSTTNGCNGGWPYNAITWVQNNGIARNTSYGPYASAVKSCPTGRVIDKPVIGTQVLTGSPAQMLTYIKNTGPVTVAYYVCTDFFYYTGGVYSGNCQTTSSTYQGGHAVTIVGYGTLNGVDYWLARNSWGPNWGIAGYFMIKRNVDDSKIESWSVVGPKCTTTA
ncbi:unnamed protein product, partial [Mesorhabditis belari]|uniref:Peptidase C1A papain C-terminal domain-containing protein n=1 Tax=Mesorhabditis belari TaxID=2138241 RepID=A0AAF3FE23_9BILA